MSDTPIFDQMRHELVGFPAPHGPAKGDVYEWLGVTVTVQRLAKDGTWADLSCALDGHTWTKRQPLPLPAEAELVATDAAVAEEYDTALTAAEDEGAALAGDEPC